MVKGRTSITWSRFPRENQTFITSADNASGSGNPRRRQAASSVLRNRQAIVIGPTPPGTGVIAPAPRRTPLRPTALTLALVPEASDEYVAPTADCGKVAAFRMDHGDRAIGGEQ